MRNSLVAVVVVMMAAAGCYSAGTMGRPGSARFLSSPLHLGMCDYSLPTQPSRAITSSERGEIPDKCEGMYPTLDFRCELTGAIVEGRQHVQCIGDRVLVEASTRKDKP